MFEDDDLLDDDVADETGASKADSDVGSVVAEFVCMSPVEDTTGKLLAIFYRLDAEGQPTSNRWAMNTNGKAWKHVDKPKPGRVYAMKVQGDTTFWPSSLTYKRLWSNQDDIAQWQTEERALLAVRATKAAAKSAVDADLIAARLEPIAKAYVKANVVTRRAIKILVLEALERLAHRLEREAVHAKIAVLASEVRQANHELDAAKAESLKKIEELQARLKKKG